MALTFLFDSALTLRKALSFTYTLRSGREFAPRKSQDWQWWRGYCYLSLPKFQLAHEFLYGKISVLILGVVQELVLFVCLVVVGRVVWLLDPL